MRMLEDKQTKVSALQVEKEAREGVIELLHKEAMKWMDRFALTLNESQELPRLLARAKEVADTYSAPDEVHSIFNYYQHMVKLMTHIIRNRWCIYVLFVEAMTSKIILMMPKNQELSKLQRIKSQKASRINFQRIMIQE